MIVQADAKGLEWLTAMYLAQDKVAIQEYLDGVDTHSSNQEFFKLPSRLIAKIFLFRIIYANLDFAAHTYANDPDFSETSSSKKFWQKVIDRFTDKYDGLVKWEQKTLQEVTTTGQIVMPTGRVYKINKDKRGEWPIPIIKNWPRQGLGADLMAIIRVSFAKRFKQENINGLLVNTVHDSIVVDCQDYELERVNQLFHDVFNDAAGNFKRVFGVEFNLPVKCEVSYGKDMKNLIELK